MLIFANIFSSHASFGKNALKQISSGIPPVRNVTGVPVISVGRPVRTGLVGGDGGSVAGAGAVVCVGVYTTIPVVGISDGICGFVEHNNDDDDDHDDADQGDEDAEQASNTAALCNGLVLFSLVVVVVVHLN